MALLRTKRIDELAALLWGQEEAQWEGILQPLCQADQALLQEVMAFARECRELQDEASPAQLAIPFPDALAVKHPAQIGNYRICRPIGAGGMGIVFEAVQLGDDLDRRVAIKVIRPGLDTEEVVRRFREERRALANLANALIVQPIDAGAMPDGRPYLVMEYVEGTPIDDYCAEHQLTIKERLELFRKVCSAIEYAHARQIVHLDLKPGNVLVTADGEPKILDFGLAKVLTPRAEGSFLRSTSSFVRAGTWAYASPEQVKGEPVNTFSDIYQLGEMFYELLAGVRPHSFEGDSYQELQHAVCEEPVKPPSEAAADGSALRSSREKLSALQLKELDELVLGALAKDPQERYQTVVAFSAVIQLYLDGKPIPVLNQSWRYRTRKFVRRHPRLILATVLGVLCLAATLGYAWRVGKAAADEARRMRQEERLERSAAEAAKEAFYEPLALFYQQFYGGEYHRVEGAEALIKKAEAGDPRAQTLVGAMYITASESVKRGLVTAGMPDDRFAKVFKEHLREEWLYKGGEGLGFLLTAAKKEPRAGALAATVYLVGAGGIDKDEALAHQHAISSAKAGDVLGTAVLGHMKWYGQGVAKDQPKGFRLLRQAAEAGSGFSQFMMCSCYGAGLVAPKDLMQSYIWCNLAAANAESTWLVPNYQADAVKARDVLEKILSREQVWKAQKVASAWKLRAIKPDPSNF